MQKLVVAGVVVLLAGRLLPQSEDFMQSAQGGFCLKQIHAIDAPPDVVYRHLVTRVGQWWDSQHTFSGDAASMAFRLTSDGGLIETLPDGGLVKHFSLIQLRPNKLLRLSGAMGPLQQHAAAGTLTLSFEPTDKGTRLTMTYNVTGFLPPGQGDFKQWAPAVDGVLRAQLQRLKQDIENH